MNNINKEMSQYLHVVLTQKIPTGMKNNANKILRNTLKNTQSKNQTKRKLDQDLNNISGASRNFKSQRNLISNSENINL